MDRVSSVFQSVADVLGPYAPRALGALLTAVAAWLAARLLRSVVYRIAAARRLDERVQTPGLSARLGDLAYWAVWLVALPGLLGALQLDGLLAPVQAMVSRLLGFLPNLIGAAAVFGVGFLAASIVRQLIQGVLSVAGSERLAARLGLTSALGEAGLAGLVSMLAFVLMLLPVVAAALQPLGLDAVTQPVSRMLDSVMALIPRLVAALIILAVAALAGRALSSVAVATLGAAGINKLPPKLGLPATSGFGGRTPAELAGAAVMLAVMMMAFTQASEVLGFAILTSAVAALGEVLARIAAATLVAVLGAWLSALAGDAVGRGASANARFWGRTCRIAILFFTAALALRQAGLPLEIVGMAFGAVVGALAVGAAVAIGVGGRHVAGRLLENLVASLEKPAQPPGARDD